MLAGGSGQTTQLGNPFLQSLQVALANTNGCPLTGNLAGINVDFAAPGGGPSGVPSYFASPDPLGDLAHAVDDGQVRTQRVLLESRQLASKVILRQVVKRGEASGEEAPPQRREGQQRETLGLAEGEDVCQHVASPERQL